MNHRARRAFLRECNPTHRLLRAHQPANVVVDDLDQTHSGDCIDEP